MSAMSLRIILIVSFTVCGAWLQWARAYQQDFPGVSRDYVSHGTRNGGPFFTAASPVQGALAGTQALDGWWSQAKQNCQGVGAEDDEQIAMRVHESQWRHWFGEADKFVAAGTVLRWKLEQDD